MVDTAGAVTESRSTAFIRFLTLAATLLLLPVATLHAQATAAVGNGGNATVIAGDFSASTLFTVTASNSTGSSQDIAITSLFPAGVSLSAGAPTAGTFSAPGASSGTWSVPDGTTNATLSFTATVGAGASTAASIQLFATPQGAAAVSSTVQIDSEADLGVAITESVATAVAGQTLTYVVTASNAGPSNSNGTQIDIDAFTLPTGVTISSATVSFQGGTYSGGTNAAGGVWTTAIPAGGSHTLTFVLALASSTAVGTDTVGISADLDASNPGVDTAITPAVSPLPDSDSETTSVTTEADLGVTVTDSVDPVYAGNNMTMTVTLTNDGPSDSSDTEVEVGAFTLPTGVTISGAPTIPGGSTYPAGTSAAGGTWTVSVAAGSSADLVFPLAIASSAAAGVDVIAASAALDALNPGVVTALAPAVDPLADSDSENTDIELQVDMEVSSKVSCPGEEVPSSCTAGTDEVSPGQRMGWEFVVENNGPSDAVGAKVVDTLTDSLHSVIWTCTPSSSNSTCPATGAGDIDIEVDVAAGDTLTFIARGWVRSDVTGSATSGCPGGEVCIENTATATAPAGADAGSTSNDSETDEIVISPIADLGVIKDDSKGLSQPSGVQLYSIRATNAGFADVLGATITDTFPAEFACSTSECWTCQADNQVSLLETQLDGLAPGPTTLEGVNAIAFSPDGKFAYASSAGDNGLQVFSRDADPLTGGAGSWAENSTFGELTPLESWVDGSGADGLENAAGVVVSPDGAQVYAIGAGADDAVARFTRSVSTGLLTFGTTVSDVAGACSSGSPENCLDDPSAIAISPDGLSVVVATSGDDAIVSFDRDASAAGVLTVAEAFEDDGATCSSSNLDGCLSDVGSLVFSQDGAYLFASSATDDSVVVFSRATDGSLTLLDAVVDASGTCSTANPDRCLDSPNQLAVLPDGSQVFVAATGSDAVVSLDFDGSDLSFSEALLHQQPDSGGTTVVSLKGVRGLALTPDGTQLAALTENGAASSVSLFAWNAGTEKLLFLADVKDDALSDGSFLAATPDNRHLAAVTKGTSGASTRNAISVLTVTRAGVCPASSSGPGTFTSLLDSPGGSPVTVDLPAGAAVEFLLFGTTTAGAVPGNQTTNTASVSDSDTDDQNSANDSDSDINDIGALADFTVTKTANVPEVAPGEQITYTVQVSYDFGTVSLSGATALSFTDMVSSELDSVTWNCSASVSPAASCPTPASGTGSISGVSLDMAPLSTVTFEITGTVKADASGATCTADPSKLCLSNTATVTLPSGFADPINGSTESDTVETILASKADLSIEKIVTTAQPAKNAQLRYVIKVRNPTGPSDVAQARVIDQIPADLLSMTWTCTATGGATCGNGELTDPGVSDPLPNTNYGLDEMVSLPVLGEVTFEIIGTVDANAGASVTNSATVNGVGVEELSSGNNVDFVTTILDAEADLEIFKDNGVPVLVPGEEVTYSLIVTNNGPNDIEQATVKDCMDPRLRNVRWTCSSEAPISGELVYLSALIDGQLPIDGIEGASDVALSPDGTTVYATGMTDNGLLVLRREDNLTNSLFGELSFQQVLFEGAPDNLATTVFGLENAKAIAVSPDGLHAYVVGDTGGSGGSIAAFSRQVNGELSFQQVIADGGNDGSNSVNLLGGASDLVVSPDGKHVYVAAPGENALLAFERDSSTGTLTLLAETQDTGACSGSALACLSGARSLALSPDGARLFVAATGDDAIAVFDRDDTTGLLTSASFLTDAGAGCGLADPDECLAAPNRVAVSADGLHVYASSADEDALTTFSVDAGGVLTPLSVVLDLVIEDPDDVTVAPDGQQVYVAANDRLVIYRRNVTTGALFLQTDLVDGSAALDANGNPTGDTVGSLEGASAVALSADGRHVYTGAALDHAVTSFTRLGSPPAFAFIESVKHAQVQSSGTVSGLEGPYTVAMAPNGNHLYVASIGSDSLAVFERDGDDGRLLFVESLVDGGFDSGNAQVDGLQGASGVAVSPDNANVYAVGQEDDAIAVYDRNSTTGELTVRQVLKDGGMDPNGTTVNGMFGATAVIVSGDGNHVYVASQFDGTVVVFARDVDGTLTFVEEKANGIDQVTGLELPSALALTDDGNHLYVAAAQGDGIVVFERDAGSGELDFVEFVAGVDRPLGIAVSPDPGDGKGSRNVYVASSNDDSITSYLRNVDTESGGFGTLTKLDTIADGNVFGSRTLDGLDGARSVVVSGDGKNVYVTGEFDDSLVVFGRESVAGRLTWLESRRDQIDGVEDLDQPYSVALSPNGRHVYAVSQLDNAVVHFERASGARCTGSGVGDLLDTVDIGANGTLTYVIEATVAPNAYDPLSTMLSNTAFVAVPPGATETLGGSTALGALDACAPADIGAVCDVGDNNCSNDTDALTPIGDLDVTKTNSLDTMVPGEEVTYTLVIDNDGPSNLVGATVYDDMSSIFPDGAEWQCTALGSGTLDFLQARFDGDELDAPEIVGGIAGAVSVAVAPDPDGTGLAAGGEHIYVTGLSDDALASFSVDPVDGSLEFLDFLVDGIDVPSGLDGAADVALSPDGEHVYVAGRVADAVTVFSRTAATGALAWEQTLADGQVQGVETIDGLDGASAVLVSPDGEHVYVAGANDGAVAVFERNTSSGGAGFGQLTFVEVFDSTSGLAGASALAMDSGGENLYVAGTNDGAIVVLDRNASTGRLSPRDVKNTSNTSELAGASSVGISPDDASVYVGSEASSAVIVYQRDLANGSLLFEQVLVNGGPGASGIGGATSLAVSPIGDGFHVYVVGAIDNGLTLFNRETEPSSPDLGRLTLVETLRQGLDGVSGLEGPQDIAISPDGRFLFVVSRVSGSVTVFRRDAATSCPTSGAGTVLSDTVDIAVGGRLIYEITGTIDPDACPPPYPCSGTEEDPGNGTTLKNKVEVTVPGYATDSNEDNNESEDEDSLSVRTDLRITKTDNEIGVEGLSGATDAAISNDGTRAYVAGFLDNALAVFERSTVDGSLQFLGRELDGESGIDGLNGASAVAVNGAGSRIYVAAVNDNSILVLEPADSPGDLLDFVQIVEDGQLGVQGLLGPRDLVFSPDGAFLYAASSGSNAIAVFEVDDEDGTLTFVEFLQDGAGGVDGLQFVESLAMSTDGEHLYAASSGDQAVAVFERDGADGTLIFLQFLVDGGTDADLNPLDLLGEANRVAVAEDGAHVYVGARGDNAVTVFERAGNGELTFVESLVEGGTDSLSTPLEGLVDVTDILITKDNAHVYVSSSDGTIVSFDRNAVTGALTLFAVQASGTEGTGYEDARALAKSFNGANVYAVGFDDGAIVAFDRDNGSGSPDYGEIVFLEKEANGDGGLEPGSPITYVIEVSNLGPSSIDGVRVVDVFPGELTDVTWGCLALNDAQCSVPSGQGDMDVVVNIDVDGKVRFTATADVATDVTGTLSNTAFVEAPEGVIEVDPENNSATDDNTLLSPRAELKLTKSIAPVAPLGPEQSVVAGAPLQYLVLVENDGPSDAAGAMVVDLLPEAFADAEWVCLADPVPGVLQFFDVESQGVDDPDPGDQSNEAVDGLSGASAVALSPDGQHLYASGAVGASIAVFDRDIRTGELSFLQSLANGDQVKDEDDNLIGFVDGLAGATEVVVSPDGAHVYVAGGIDDAIAVFERDGTSGELTFLAAVLDGVAGVNGLGNVADLVLDSSGAQLLASSPSDGSVVVFSRNASTGLLIPVPSADVTGLAGAEGIALSADDRHLYVAMPSANSLARVSRNTGTGDLTLDAILVDGVDSISGLLGASDAVVSPDGLNVYVASVADSAVTTFLRDPNDGSLTLLEVLREGDVQGVSVLDGLFGAESLAISGDGEHLYVVSPSDDGIAVFARAVSGGLLTFLQAVLEGDPLDVGVIDGLQEARRIAISPDDDDVYVVSPYDSSVVGFVRSAGSKCAPSGVGNVLDNVTIAAGGSILYTISGAVLPSANGLLSNTASVEKPEGIAENDTADNQETVDRVIGREADLQITKTDGETEAIPGLPVTYDIAVTNLGPSDVAGALVNDLLPRFNSSTPGDGGFVDGTLEWACTATSVLEVVDTEFDGGAAAKLAGAKAVASSPDGEFVYVASANDDAVVVFDRDTGSGELTFVQEVADGDLLGVVTVDSLDEPFTVAVSPDGAHLYVGAHADDAITVFARDLVTGMLTFVESVADGDSQSTSIIDGLDGVASIALTPHGLQLYATGLDDDAVVAFDRDNDPNSATFGTLLVRTRIKDGFGALPIGTIAGPRHLAISPSGQHVYVAAQSADRVAAFERDTNVGTAAFGVLTLIETEQDNTNDPSDPGAAVEGLDLVVHLALSPKGRFLYAASLADNAVSVFERDGSDGSLSFVGVVEDGVLGLTGLQGPTSVELSPNGQYLFVTARNEDAVSVFEVNPISGLLTKLETQGPANGNDDLDGARDLAVSPDGSHIYVVSELDSSLVGFSVNPQAVCTESGTGDLITSVDLGVGATALFSITADLDPASRGTLTNVVTATVPAGTTDPNLPNEAQDVNTLTPFADVSVTKTDGLLTSVAGVETTYTIVVQNAGPSTAFGVAVADVFPTGTNGFVPSSIEWCAGPVGPACVPSTPGNVNSLLDLDPGSATQFIARAVVDPSSTGDVANTATASSGDATDDTPGNNAATDTNATVVINDLGVTKTDFTDLVALGGTTTYEIVVTNLGPSDATALTVTDAFPAGLINSDWICELVTPGDCGSATNSAGIAGTIDLAAGASAVYTVTSDIDPGLLLPASIVNTVVVAPSPQATDPATDNNDASDTNDVVEPDLFSDGFESGDISAWEATPRGLTVEVTSVVTDTSWRDVSLSRDLQRLRLGFTLRSEGDLRRGKATYELLNAWRRPAGDARVNRPQSAFVLEARPASGGTEVRLRGVENEGSEVDSDWILIPDRAQVEIDWSAARRPASRNGALRIWVDGRLEASLTGIDNDGLRVDGLRFGTRRPVPSSGSARHRFDEIEWTDGEALPRRSRRPAPSERSVGAPSGPVAQQAGPSLDAVQAFFVGMDVYWRRPSTSDPNLPSLEGRR